MPRYAYFQTWLRHIRRLFITRTEMIIASAIRHITYATTEPHTLMFVTLHTSLHILPYVDFISLIRCYAL